MKISYLHKEGRYHQALVVDNAYLLLSDINKQYNTAFITIDEAVYCSIHKRNYLDHLMMDRNSHYVNINFAASLTTENYQVLFERCKHLIRPLSDLTDFDIDGVIGDDILTIASEIFVPHTDIYDMWVHILKDNDITNE